MQEYRESTTLTRMYWGEGLSTYQIGDHFGVSESTVRYWMDHHGIERRDYHEAATVDFPATDALHALPVHVDDREPTELLDVLDARTDFTPETRHLRTGDLVFPTHDAAVERKTFSDAVGSNANGRLWEQVERLEHEYTRAAVVVTGQYLHPIRASAHDGEPACVRSVLGAISHINEQRVGVHAVWLPGDDTDSTPWGMIQLAEYVDRWLTQIES